MIAGRYALEAEIGRGGMGAVWRGRDEVLGRTVALKQIGVAPGGLSADALRAEREAKLAAKLNHANVVAVFDQGEDDGHMFLAMEYVPGQTLRDVLRDEGPLSPRAALDVLEPVLLALAEAHAKGLIHRDVKPENVILREDGAVKVADFGLARAVTSHNVTSSSGLLLGTVSYLSPEQVEAMRA